MSVAARHAIDWTEQGYVPDAVIRAGIRRLLHARLEELQADSIERALFRTAEFVAQMDRANLPKVEMLMGYQGAKMDEAIKAYADAGVKGIVLAGGGGSQDADKYAEGKGVTFVRTQRFRSGAENFMPQKARLLRPVAAPNRG